jgi:hypothetical protein
MQDDITDGDPGGLDGLYDEGFPIPDGGVHAVARGRKPHRPAISQQVGIQVYK